MKPCPLGRIFIVIGVTLGQATSVQAASPRAYEGEREATWVGSAPGDTPTASVVARSTTVPAPRVEPREPTRETIDIAVGLAPDAPGSKSERAVLDALEHNVRSSADPTTRVRRLRPGAGEARQICRDRLDDVVILIGYMPGRDDAVLLPYDCRLDVALGIRAHAASDEPTLVAVLWQEHRDRVRSGMRERRAPGRLSKRARAGIAAGVAVAVVGVVVGLLVANALRDEKVVIKVAP